MLNFVLNISIHFFLFFVIGDSFQVLEKDLVNNLVVQVDYSKVTL